MMLRVLSFLLVVAYTSADFACTGSSGTEWSDGNSCVTCSNRVENVAANTATVTIDGSGCKCDALSWICCASTACTASSCGYNKCETVWEVDYTVPLSTQFIEIKMHDGQVDPATADFYNDDAPTICKSGILSTVSTETVETADKPMKGCTITVDVGATACGVKPSDDLCSEGNGDDPHIKTFDHQWYDYQGECDLVMLHAPQFAQGLGLDIHIRTKIRYDYSYISNAAMQIGDEVFEVASYGDYLLNGISGADLPASIAGYPIAHRQTDDKMHVFSVDLGHGQLVHFRTFKDFVTVKFEKGLFESDFGESLGLMGSFDTREMLARDGTTVMSIATQEDANAFAQEWQVRDTEPMLFQTARAPQFPAKCLLPQSKPAIPHFLRSAGQAK